MRRSHKMTTILSVLIWVYLSFIPVVLHATADADSWQKQILLATTNDSYLVMETSGFTPGFPPEYTEVVRYVIYDVNTNEQISEVLVSVIKSRFVDGGATPEKVTQASDSALSKMLSDFGGRIPRTAKNLTKPFEADESGLYVVNGNDRVLVFTAEELALRKSGAGNAYGLELPKAISLQFGGGKYFLTMRSFFGNGGHEVVMAMTR